MSFLEQLLHLSFDWFAIIGGPLLLLVNVCITGHVLLHKTNTRAAAGWIGLTWLSPGLGPILYVLFGINRIERKAQNVYGQSITHVDHHAPPEQYTLSQYEDAVHPASLAKIVGRVSNRELTTGNRIRPLIGGEETYPEMLEAIRNAERSVTLCTYIFANDHVGQQFVDALRDAVNRGVEVRVLIDDVGARYSFPTIIRKLRNADIPVARFMETWIPWRFRYVNLRNHRKIMVVDGSMGFTGGMNIDADYMASNASASHQDLHFLLEGPVVTELQDAFAQDWDFATGEGLDGDTWYARPEPAGDVPARGIVAGPDESYDNLRITFLGAIACAEQSIRIITPYFLPDEELVGALQLASRRDVDIEIFLPEVNTPRLVQWASMATLELVLQQTCSVYLTPPPFDHTKLFVIDDSWVTFGSTNWDPRSLKLNFELNVECYSEEVVESVQPEFQTRREQGTPLTLEDLQNRSFPVRMRDAATRLFSPYL